MTPLKLFPDLLLQLNYFLVHCYPYHIRRGPAQESPFSYMPSHFSELQIFKSIIQEGTYFVVHLIADDDWGLEYEITCALSDEFDSWD